MPESDGATVNFRVGSLVHCLSTDKRCRGAVSSLGKTDSRDDPEMLMQELQSLLAADNWESALCNKSVEDLLSRLDTAQHGSAPDRCQPRRRPAAPHGTSEQPAIDREPSLARYRRDHGPDHRPLVMARFVVGGHCRRNLSAVCE